MNRLNISLKMVLITSLCFFTFVVSGCDCSKKLETAQQQNQMLAQRVAELEAQLQQTQANAAAITPAPAQMERKVYLVVAGDSLWSIAEKQLGSGSRYKEIQALNPDLGENQPLAIGMELILPAE